VTVFRWIAAEKANHTIATMCRVLGVSRSGYHAWEHRPPSDRALQDAWLTEKIRVAHKLSLGTYGERRMHAELREEHGVYVGRKRVQRLMAAAGLRGAGRPRRPRTTISVPGVKPAEDLVQRDFNPTAPNLLWSSDFTYIATAEGWLYLAGALDCFSRRLVGWSMAEHMRTELVVDALQMAVARRRPGEGLVHHSDRGSQGGFTRSSQHLDRGGCDGQASGMDEGVDGPVADEVAGQAVASARCRASVLAADRRRLEQRRRGAGGRGVAGGWQPMVQGAWRDGDVHARAGLVPVFVL
jgi:putative transposase